MSWFPLWSLLLCLVYLTGVLAYRRQAESVLETVSESLFERIQNRAAVLVLGATLILVAGGTFEEGSATITSTVALRWGLLPETPFSFRALESFSVASLLHWDIVHLLSNLLILPFLLPYERRVGAYHFLLVFFLTALWVSIVEDSLPLGPAISLGASGGICGLITAYNVDRVGMDRKEWFTRLILTASLIGLVSLQSVLRESKAQYSVDWVAHLLAVPIGAMVCWILSGRRRTSK